MENPAYSHWNTEDAKHLPTDNQIDPSFQQADYTADAVAVAQSVHDPTAQMMPPVDQPINQSRSRRPLSQSKRAQQNRAAQRAFRQRKELYIKDLESKVQELKTVKETMEALRAENQELRDYILALQSRWINQPGGVPTPPAVYARRGVDEGDNIQYDEKAEDQK